MGNAAARDAMAATAEPGRGTSRAPVARVRRPREGYSFAARVVGGVAGLGAACGNSVFVLAGPLGSTLSAKASYVSELEVGGEPASGLFRAFDIATGAMIIAVALTLPTALSARLAVRVVSVSLCGAGIASIFDALNPMPCAPSVDLRCRSYEETANLVVQLQQGHTVSSVLGELAMFAAMSALAVVTWRGTNRRLARIAVGLGMGFAVSGLATVTLTLVGSQDVGAVERAQVAVESAWLALLAVHVCTGNRRTRAGQYPQPLAPHQRR
ncbi:hypothetical protein GCM10017786_60640 [Amycolatopsis deserti]|uniref:DUF998 domain-containing protein n=1 Tax=Amycolatopsis deserti TaxID=185696 RepID=A0ABQ3JBH7_9PSEU|nr:DUF998 domain-containing protein [Amycolatopsis deserti]GHF18756.1 hypothetical protein GCM10017786_60640 [Amycolatopsis deserti]